MKIEISIDDTCKEPKIIILTDKMTDEISEILKRLSATRDDTLTVFSQRGVEIIEYNDIVRIFSENKKVFVQTIKDRYTVHARLYELEERLDTYVFVRISNSEIINIKKIKNMDISLAGTICVFLQGDIKTYVSRRYVAKIKQTLGI